MDDVDSGVVVVTVVNGVLVVDSGVVVVTISPVVLVVDSAVVVVTVVPVVLVVASGLVVVTDVPANNIVNPVSHNGIFGVNCSAPRQLQSLLMPIWHAITTLDSSLENKYCQYITHI